MAGMDEHPNESPPVIDSGPTVPPRQPIGLGNLLLLFILTPLAAFLAWQATGVWRWTIAGVAVICGATLVLRLVILLLNYILLPRTNT